MSAVLTTKCTGDLGIEVDGAVKAMLFAPSDRCASIGIEYRVYALWEGGDPIRVHSLPEAIELMFKIAEVRR